MVGELGAESCEGVVELSPSRALLQRDGLVRA